jgi:serine/threonine protein kinase
MVDDGDEIHLIDFGIAASAGARRLTFAHFSQSMGTPDYISPEQVRGKRGDARSDIYALGVMLYEMLTGVVPFSGANPFAVMNDRLLNQPVPPRELEPSITPQLQEIVYRAMEREPKNRYASAREMAHDLLHPDEVGVAPRPDAERWKTRRSPERRRMLLYAGLALIPVCCCLDCYCLSRGTTDGRVDRRDAISGGRIRRRGRRTRGRRRRLARGCPCLASRRRRLRGRG